MSGASSYTMSTSGTVTEGGCNQSCHTTNHVDNGSYDAMGNMTHDQLNSSAYDAEGRLCAVAPQAGGATGYLYDAEGQRWAKGSIGSLSCNFSSNGFAATSTYLLGPAGEQLTELNGAGGWVHTNVFAAGSLLATYDSIGTHFALADWLGIKRIQASATGGIDETCMSLPSATP
jgi:YD repeat-containing protein